jgi:PAS domain S-box-containing protein
VVKLKVWRSMAVVVVLFTAMAVSMVWVLSLKQQDQLRQQMLDQAEARAQQLANAMGGQVQAYSRLMDRALLELRDKWPSPAADFALVVDQSLTALPPGLVSHVTVVDADGVVVFNSLGLPLGLSMADRPHFQQLRSGGDGLVVGEPVRARLADKWLFVVGRPILRDGRFDGAVHLLVSTDFLAETLGRLTLTEHDLVALVHPNGRFLARSLDNDAAMGQALPTDRPFVRDKQALQGSFRQTGAVDGKARLFGWQRLPPSGEVLVVGLSEAGVLKPLEDAWRRALWLTALLSLALALVGFWIGWLQWRLEQGQKDMAESRARLQEAQRMAQVGHWVFDQRNGEMLWSDEVFRIFGQDPAKFHPSFQTYWQQVSAEDKPALKQMFDDALADLSDLDSVHRIVRPDGSERFVRLLCQSEHGDLGPTYHGTLQDVTELHQAQQALEQLNAGLEHSVKQRTGELRALNRELESFTYSVSHDLRTPLRSIHGFASLLAENEAGRLTEEGRAFLARIQDGARRMGLLITDLLSMAQHSRALISHQTVDLSELARGVVADLEREQTGRQVQWQIEPGLRVQADPTLMRVVLQNLLGNAWKYTGQTAQARISFTRADGVGAVDGGGGGDGHQHFCVRDNGAGFDMAYVDQLFQPFKRLHAHHEFEGTGIGLATVARVVQRHGGTVRAEGAVGQGAAFCFSLPSEPVAPALPPEPGA